MLVAVAVELVQLVEMDLNLLIRVEMVEMVLRTVLQEVRLFMPVAVVVVYKVDYQA
jgi:hypothetical protein